jgi:hypothetical protein
VPDQSLLDRFAEYTNRSFKQIPDTAAYASLLNAGKILVLYSHLYNNEDVTDFLFVSSVIISGSSDLFSLFKGTVS